jgi:pseudaminic acid cytidylyltransferase
MKIAIIPARGGSKLIPKKNIKTFAGKPMIAHAILNAKETGLFAHIIVPTDDEEVSKFIIQGGEITFTHPSELVDHHSVTGPHCGWEGFFN